MILCGEKLKQPLPVVSYEGDLRGVKDAIDLLGRNGCSKCIRKYQEKKPVGRYIAGVMEGQPERGMDGARNTNDSQEQ